MVRHPLWDTLSLPLLALLYVRKKDIPPLAKAYPWELRTKLELAAELAGWLARWLRHAGKALWLVADGAYAKRPFLKPALALGLVVFSRLRKDARLGACLRPGAGPASAGRCRPTTRAASTWPSGPGRSAAGRWPQAERRTSRRNGSGSAASNSGGRAG